MDHGSLSSRRGGEARQSFPVKYTLHLSIAFMQVSVICQTFLAAKFLVRVPHTTFLFSIPWASPAHRFRLDLFPP